MPVLATFVIPKPSWWTLALLIDAIVASFFKFGLPLIDQLGYGWAEKVDFRDAVVVITGGGRGLGRLMADMLVEKGAKVAILDIRSTADAKEKFTFIKTDVGDEKAVLQAKAKIEKQVRCVRYDHQLLLTLLLAWDADNTDKQCWHREWTDNARLDDIRHGE